MITLKNEILTVIISEYGAELQSVKSENKEFLWQGNPDVWSGRAPILFPICGELKNNTYTVDGKSFELPRHGFARKSEFTAEQINQKEAVFTLFSNEETKKTYPFDFVLKIKYTLCDNAIEITNTIENKSNGMMYFSIGSHEGYDCPEGVGAYKVVFEKPEVLDAYPLVNNLLAKEPVRILDGKTELPLSKEMFANDALVFKKVNSRKVSMQALDSSRTVTVEFPDCDFLLLWTKPSGEYLCIEPWCGVADSVDSDGVLAHKEGILCLETGQKKEIFHRISFSEK